MQRVWLRKPAWQPIGKDPLRTKPGQGMPYYEAGRIGRFAFEIWRFRLEQPLLNHGRRQNIRLPPLFSSLSDTKSQCSVLLANEWLSHLRSDVRSVNVNLCAHVQSLTATDEALLGE